jgi:hypothetical protein
MESYDLFTTETTKTTESFTYRYDMYINEFGGSSGSFSGNGGCLGSPRKHI